jgi:hypothetical protein
MNGGRLSVPGTTAYRFLPIDGFSIISPGPLIVL